MGSSITMKLKRVSQAVTILARTLATEVAAVACLQGEQPGTEKTYGASGGLADRP